MINPAFLKTQIAEIIRKERQKIVLKKASPQDEIVTPTPKVTSKPPEPVARNSRYRTKAGKRFRLIPVDAYGQEVKDESLARPRKANKRSVLRSNVESTTPTEDPRNDRNVCVLYTNFTSEGDYINDHDYLVNPYVRNKIFHRGTVPVCVCLLCDLLHPAKDHIDHMKTHKTVCQFCQVDFHNVFILNLHVRCHTTYCSECLVEVSYAGQVPHAQLHNKSLTLSNVHIRDDIIERFLDKPKETISQLEKEPPEREFPTLKDLLSKPVDDKHYKISRSGNSSPSICPRRSKRLTRSRKLEIDDSNVDEEACIYDKSTKSFITPSAQKQQKLLKEFAVEKTESNKNTEEPDKKTSDFAAGKTDSENININTLLAGNEKEPVSVSHKRTNVKIDSDKILNKVIKKRRRRIFETPKSRRRRVKILNISKEVQKNIEKLEVHELPKIDSPESSKSDPMGTKSDVLETNEVKNPEITEEGAKSGDSKQINTDTPQSQSRFSEEKLVRKRMSDLRGTKRTLGNLKVEIVDVLRTYGRWTGKRNKRTEIAQLTSPVAKEEDRTATLLPEESNTKEENTNVKKEFEPSNIDAPEMPVLGTKPVETSTKQLDNSKRRRTKPPVPKNVSSKATIVQRRQPGSVPVSDLSVTTCTSDNVDRTLDEVASGEIMSEKENTIISQGGRTSTSENIDKTLDRVVGGETTPERESTKTSQGGKIKSPRRGGLKIKIKGINYNPFVTLANLSKKDTDTEGEIVQTGSKRKRRVARTRETLKKKRKTDAVVPEIIHDSPPVNEKEGNTAENYKMQESPDTVVVKEGSGNLPHDNLEKSVMPESENSRKDLRPNPFRTGPKPRSSRSRGSSGLVEGLKFPDKRYGSRRVKRNLHDDSLVDLDTSQPKNVDSEESSQLKDVQPHEMSVNTLETIKSEDTVSHLEAVQPEETTTLSLVASSKLETSEPVESSAVCSEMAVVRNE